MAWRSPCTPETRRIYREPRTLLVLAGAALPILPFALWLATIDPGPRRPPHDAHRERACRRRGRCRASLVFLTGIPLVFLPWIAFVLFFAWRFPNARRHRRRLSQVVAIRLAKPHGDRDAGADGRAPAVRVCDGRRAVRHQGGGYWIARIIKPVLGLAKPDPSAGR
mgnify:CR=1 FL=1